MSDTAFQIQYRQEFIRGFEQHTSLLRMSTTTEAQIKGNQATFLVADSGGATAVTRGVNGLIPGRADNLNQYTATLAEWHDKPTRTNFNIFASQGDGKRIMQETSMAVINRQIDQDILTALSSSTHNTGAATTASLSLAMKAKTILQVAAVPNDGNITAVISPAFEAYLMQTPEFANALYVGGKPMEGDDMAWKDQVGYYRWIGVNWIVHPKIAGIGTNAEVCYMYHKSAIGHAVDTAGIMTEVDYNREHDYSYSRCSVYMGSKMLQNSGIVTINHDGSGYAAS